MIYLRIPFSCFFQVLYHSINTGVRGTCPPTGVGAEPLLHPVSTRPTSAASGAAQPPRPQGAGFRRKREPRGAGGRRKPVQTLCVKTGVRGTEPLQMGRVPPIRPQGRRPFNASLRLSAPYYSAAYPRTRIARRISHKIVGRGVDYDSPADYLRNGEALGVYRAESKSVV